MTTKEKLKIHDQIEQENREKLNEFKAETGGLLRYGADNMESIFQPGDLLYIVLRRYPVNGSIMVIRQDDRNIVCRVNKAPEGYIITDDKNPPQIVEDPDFVGTVVGYERMF